MLARRVRPHLSGLRNGDLSWTSLFRTFQRGRLKLDDRVWNSRSTVKNLFYMQWGGTEVGVTTFYVPYGENKLRSKKVRTFRRKGIQRLEEYQVSG